VLSYLSDTLALNDPDGKLLSRRRRAKSTKGKSLPSIKSKAVSSDSSESKKSTKRRMENMSNSTRTPSSNSKQEHKKKQRYHMKSSEGNGSADKRSSGASYKDNKGSSKSPSYMGKEHSTMASRKKQTHHMRPNQSAKGKGGGSYKGKGKGSIPSKGEEMGTPTDAPTKPINSSVFPRSPPLVLPGWIGPVAVAWGDPHVVTFDRLAYDCQARGDFVFTKALDDSIEVQGRFTSSSESPEISITTAVAAFVKGIGKVEIYTSSEGSIESAVVGTCPLNIYINGALLNVASGSLYDDLLVDIIDEKVDIYFANSSLVMTVLALPWFENQCLLNTFIGIPEKQPILGLLGSARNGIMNDDWGVTSSTFLGLPTTQEGLMGEEAYDYCTKQWCIRNKTNSLFTIDEELDLTKSCDFPFPGGISATSAPDNILKICGAENPACLIDGIVGGSDGAQGAVEVAAQFEELDNRNGSQLTGPPTSMPSSSPTTFPSTPPSDQPTMRPSARSNGFPSAGPSYGPSQSPTSSLSMFPSSSPSDVPSTNPTSPMGMRSLAPTERLSLNPTSFPTAMEPFTGSPTTFPSSLPTTSPSFIGTSVPSTSPTQTPTGLPSSTRTLSPTLKPSTTAPSGTPSMTPSNFPSVAGQPTISTAQPSTIGSSGTPSESPSLGPTNSLTDLPSVLPSATPTSIPTKTPSLSPTTGPVDPTDAPIGAIILPTTMPSTSPTGAPSILPIEEPSSIPSGMPTTNPSSNPTLEPNLTPTLSPSSSPSIIPTTIPSSTPNDGTLAFCEEHFAPPLGSTNSTILGKIGRSLGNTTCDSQNFYPGTFARNNLRYYEEIGPFRNPSFSDSTCVIVNFNPSNCVDRMNTLIHATAYTEFDPDNMEINYLGDIRDNDRVFSFEFSVGANTTFYVVGQAFQPIDPPENVENGTGCTFSVNVTIDGSCGIGQ